MCSRFLHNDDTLYGLFSYNAASEESKLELSKCQLVSRSWFAVGRAVLTDPQWLAPFVADAHQTSLSIDAIRDNKQQAEAIVATMWRFRSCANVQTASCRQISMDCMRQEHQLAMSGNAAVDAVMTAVVQVMKRHKTNASVQEHACKALKRLTFGTHYYHTLERTRGLEKLVAVMDEHRSNLVIQENAADVMLGITCHAPSATLVSRVGGVEAIMDAMFVCPRAVLEHKTMVGIKTAIRTYNHDTHLIRPIARSIFAAMKMRGADPQAQIKACRVIALATAHTKYAAKTMLEEGGLHVVLDTLAGPYGHINDPQVVVAVLDALKTISYPLPNTNESPAFCIPIAIQAMAIHHNVEAVQALGCALIGSIFKTMPADPTPLRAQALHVLFACTRTWLHSHCVQERAIKAIAIVCTLHQGIQSVVESDALRILVASMTYHSDDLNIQKFGCNALFNITKCEKYTLQVANAGAISALTTSMKNSAYFGGYHDSLLQHAAHALAQLGRSDTSILKFLKAQRADRVLKKALHSRCTNHACKEEIGRLLSRLHAV